MIYASSRLHALKFFFSHTRLFQNCQIRGFFQFTTMKRNHCCSPIRMYKKPMCTTPRVFIKTQLLQFSRQFLRSRRQLNSLQNAILPAVQQIRVLFQHQIKLSRLLSQFQDQTNLRVMANHIPNDTGAILPALRLSSRVHELTNHHQKARLERLERHRTKFQARVDFCKAKLNSFSWSQYRTQLEVLT